MMQIVDKPKLRGPKLRSLIILTIYTCRTPIKTKDILIILRRNHQVSERTFHLKMKELLEEAEIVKRTNLEQPNSIFYFRS